MDQIKIGAFIKAERRKKGLTQRALADMLGVSDKAVSKWETGSGLPDVSLMMPLCDILEISVNELLSAERLDQNQYRKRAEENIMSIMEKTKRDANRLIIISYILIGILLLVSIGTIVLAGLADLENWTRILLIAFAVAQMVITISIGAAIDMKIGSFECTKCDNLFVPTPGQYLLGAHTVTRRRLTCPCCGKRSYCIKRLASPEKEEQSDSTMPE